MLDEGADIVDIGAYSSRPGAADVPEDEEFNRLWKVLQIIKRDYPEVLVSIDTFRLSVIKRFLISSDRLWSTIFPAAISTRK